MKPIQFSDFLNFKFISGLQANPSKTQLGYVVSKPDIDKNEYHYQLYRYDGERHIKLVDLKNKGSFIFESDDTILCQLAKSKVDEKAVKESKETIYYRYTISTATLEKAYTFPIPTTIHTCLSEHTLLLTAALTPIQHRLYTDSKDERKKLLKTLKQVSNYEEIDEIPFYFNGLGFTANQRNQLFIYDTQSHRITPIVEPDFHVGVIKVSKDHQQIYFTGRVLKGIRQLTSHVHVYHVETKVKETLYDQDDCSISNLFLLENKLIVFGSDMKDYGLNQNPDVFVLDHGKLNLFNLYRKTVGNTVGSDVRLGSSVSDQILDGKLYFLSTIDDHNSIMTLDLSGSIEEVYPFNGSIEGMVFLGNKLHVIGLYRQKLQELYRIDLTLEKQEIISRFNIDALRNQYVATPKEYYLKSKSHGVKGWVLFPKDYDPSLSYPTILDIHGGPKTVYGTVYYHEMQCWANMGYIVLFCNPRGSDGKGNQFADIRGKYGTIDYEDIMKFTDYIIKRIPSVDVSRLFVTGGSYGGFMTNWMVGHTNRFKAAVTQRSISNWLSFHGTSDIGYYFSADQTAGHPIMDTEKLWNQSPMKYANQVETPLLFIHSDSDYRCPIEQAMQFYTVLKQKGLKTKLIWFKGETHELSRSGKPQARIKRLEEITSWFESFR